MKKIFFIILLSVNLFISCDTAKKMLKKDGPSESDVAKSVLDDILAGRQTEVDESSILPFNKDALDKLKGLVKSDSIVSKMSKKELKKYKKELDKAEKLAMNDTLNPVQKVWYTVFPKKVKRILTYDKMYKEKPKTIMVLYPWNRSKHNTISEMFYTTITRELTYKGYYVLPIMPMFDMYKSDSLFSSKYIKHEDISKYKEMYGVDAVLFVTVFNAKKEWWSTSVNSSAHYYMISTITQDTLFARKADFSYDSPIPPSYAKNKENAFIKDANEVKMLGVCGKMQRTIFSDLPVGPHDKKYLKDTASFSHPVEMKYKMDIRPS